MSNHVIDENNNNNKHSYIREVQPHSQYITNLPNKYTCG